MVEKVFWFALGYLTARYLIINNANYLELEAQKIDSIREAAHNLIKKYAPNADDVTIGDDVMKNIK